MGRGWGVRWGACRGTGGGGGRGVLLSARERERKENIMVLKMRDTHIDLFEGLGVGVGVGEGTLKTKRRPSLTTLWTVASATATWCPPSHCRAVRCCTWSRILQSAMLLFRVRFRGAPYSDAGSADRDILHSMIQYDTVKYSSFWGRKGISGGAQKGQFFHI